MKTNISYNTKIKSPSTSNHAVTFLELLFLLFLGLKLAGKIDWSWWWVFAPIWIPIALVGIVVLLAILEWVIDKMMKKAGK